MQRRLFAAALAALALSSPVAAKPVTDCPNRNAPFSTSSPLIDILLSPAAKAIVDSAMPGRLDKMPPIFAGTKPPSFAAILDLNTAARFVGGATDKIAALDAPLRALPVTAADKVARCARYDNDVPKVDLPKGKPRILLFEKINGFRDGPSVDAAHAAFVAMAARKDWGLVATQNGGAFNPATLAKFDAVVWNNISGDVLTLSQRKAFQAYLAKGGAFVGVHGSAGDPVYFWDWYPDTLIGARFLAHPRNPQFQEARVVVADPASPLATGLPAEWKLKDEWYSFKSNPRKSGAKVLLTLDESSYQPNDPGGPDLRMGTDHPIAWTNCIGRGRAFYSAIGHRPEMYSEPTYVTVLENAMSWAIDTKGCGSVK